MNTKHLPESVRAFVVDTTALAKKHNVRIYYGKGRNLLLGDGRTKVSGYFDEEDSVLAVATKKPIIKWLEVMVHESCHLDQYIQKCRYWHSELDFHYEEFDRFLQGKKVDNVEEAIDNIVMLEADCERRALKKLAEYNLPINPKTYSKRANAYLLSHKAMYHYRSWYKVGPFSYRSTWITLPDTISAPSTYRIRNNKVDPEFFAGCFKK